MNRTVRITAGTIDLDDGWSIAVDAYGHVLGPFDWVLYSDEYDTVARGKSNDIDTAIDEALAAWREARRKPVREEA
jgi:hypothetical protein